MEQANCVNQSLTAQSQNGGLSDYLPHRKRILPGLSLWGSFGVGVANLLSTRIMLGKRCECSQTTLFTGPYAQVKYKTGSNQTSKTALYQDFKS